MIWLPRASASVFAFAAVASALLPAVAIASPLPPLLGGGKDNKPAATASDLNAPRRAVQLALRIEQSDAVSPTVARLATFPAPVVLGTPRLVTVDRSTATIAVTSDSFSYAIAVSPVVETVKGDEKNGVAPGDWVQTDWSVRLTGKALPGKNSAVTLTGATRLPVDKTGELTEITLRDMETGKSTIYKIWVTATFPAPAEVK